MNTETNQNSTGRRVLMWGGWIVVIALIVWGLIAAEKKSQRVAVTPLSLPTEVTAEDWSTGSSTAPVTLVEYSDFQCPACGAYYPLVKQLRTEFADELRVVYRHFPLPQHEHAYPAAIASEAAGNQGKFWEMGDMIFEKQKDWDSLTIAQSEAMFTSYAEKLGLDMKKYASDVKDTATREKIADSLRVASRAGINSTPTFFLNGQVIKNPTSYEAFKALIEEAIK